MCVWLRLHKRRSNSQRQPFLLPAHFQSRPGWSRHLLGDKTLSGFSFVEKESTIQTLRSTFKLFFFACLSLLISEQKKIACVAWSVVTSAGKTLRSSTHTSLSSSIYLSACVQGQWPPVTECDTVPLSGSYTPCTALAASCLLQGERVHSRHLYCNPSHFP